MPGWGRQGEKLCARALAILSHPDLPFNPTGWEMVEPEDPLLLSADRNNIRLLPAGYGLNLECLAQKSLLGLSLSIDPATWQRISKSRHFQEMKDSIRLGYDSESDTCSIGSARGWAAWLAGETGTVDAVPSLIFNLTNDCSETAKQQYIIALARLDGPKQAQALLTTLKTGNKSASKWSSGFPYWLDDQSPSFTFGLSDRAAAAIGVAHLQGETPLLRQGIDTSLLEQFYGLLSPEVLNPFSKKPMRTWAGHYDAGEQTGVFENNQSFFVSLIFSMAKRQTPGAEKALAAYFRSIGHHPHSDYRDPNGKLVDPGNLIHTVDTYLLLSAIHHLNPQIARSLWIEKAQEMNEVFKAANVLGSNGYAAGTAAWRFMFLDDGLYEAARLAFGKRADELINQFPKTKKVSNFSGFDL